MADDKLESLARSQRWADLEREWLAALEKPGAEEADLLRVIDLVVKAGQGKLADTLGWAWLSVLKERCPAAEVLEIGRHLLVHLSDGEELREEIVSLYQETHSDRADLAAWMARSGLSSGKSVRRALRYLDVGLQLGDGKYLVHRTDDTAGQIVSMDPSADAVEIRTARRTQSQDLAAVIDGYDVVDDDDFRVLIQLRPERFRELLDREPCAAAISILRSHGGKMNRDAFKLMLVPQYLAAEQWQDWWTRLRNGLKKSSHLRIEGRSPMFLVFDAAGRTPEDDLADGLAQGDSPRAWLEMTENYLRDCKARKKTPDARVMEKTLAELSARVARFLRHKEPQHAFATALVIERLSRDIAADDAKVHGLELKMIRESADPAALVAAGVTDARLWPPAIAAVEQALPDAWPKTFAELILRAPPSQCDILAKKMESAGHGALLQDVADRALADPGRYTDALMWLWKEPAIETSLKLPPATEMVTLILGLVGPALLSEGRIGGQHVNELRAKVRSGLAVKDYERFRHCINDLDDAMGMAVRRLVERAEGLGPTVQEDLLNIVRVRFAHLYVKPKVAPWDDESTLYFTQPGLSAKEKELAEIVNVKMRENAKAIGEAAAHGDLSENSEYKFALEERDLLRARVAKLNREISMAKVLEPGEVPTDHVSIGQRVHLAPMNGGQGLVVSVMGFDEADIGSHVFSYQSPIARKLLGKKPGEQVHMSILGDENEYRIDRIEKAI